VTIIGKAIINERGELRSCGIYKGHPCDKLIAKLNIKDVLAGSFRCRDCKQDIEVV
jgi:hypothetical protein